MASKEQNVDVKDEKNESSKCWCFTSTYCRITAGIMICIVCFSDTFTSDNAGSLQSEIQSMFNLKVYEFEYLYSVAMIATIPLGFIGGAFIDRVLGLFRAAIIVGMIGVSSQIIYLFGAFMEKYWLMLIGRFFLGMSLCGVEITNYSFVVLWFQGKGLNFLFGLGQSMSRLGTSAVFLSSSAIQSGIVQELPQHTALTICIIPCVIASLAILMSLFFLGYFGKKLGHDVGKKLDNEKDSISFMKTLNFTLPLWMIIMIIAAMLTTVVVFNSLAQRLMMHKFGIEQWEANRFISIFNMIGAITSPIPGLIIDKIGREISFNMFGHILGILAHLILATTTWNPYIFLCLYAVSFSILNCCTWSVIPMVVESYQLATAYGTAESVMSLSISLLSILAGFLQDHYGVEAVMYFFIAVYSFSTMCAVTLWVWDSTSGHGLLNMSLHQRNLLHTQKDQGISKQDLISTIADIEPTS